MKIAILIYLCIGICWAIFDDLLMIIFKRNNVNFQINGKDVGFKILLISRCSAILLWPIRLIVSLYLIISKKYKQMFTVEEKKDE